MVTGARSTSLWTRALCVLHLLGFHVFNNTNESAGGEFLYLCLLCWSPRSGGCVRHQVSTSLPPRYTAHRVYLCRSVSQHYNPHSTSQFRRISFLTQGFHDLNSPLLRLTVLWRMKQKQDPL
uniref:Secreted protein n=1 Tax=Rousettus aegyptiacus TaxID=9407 RepID=A0A7J8C2T7_ROUAE|nr:hypothetical protein HJG63_009439 [Rousettus aegyptiacus]